MTYPLDEILYNKLVTYTELWAFKCIFLLFMMKKEGPIYIGLSIFITHSKIMHYTGFEVFMAALLGIQVF